VSLACTHPGAPASSRVCVHLLDAAEPAHYIRFTGKGREYDLICPRCGKQPETIEPNLREVCSACLQRIEEGYWEDGGIAGAPQVLTRPSSLHFVSYAAPLAPPLTERLLALQPIPVAQECTCIGLTASGKLIRVNLTTGQWTETLQLPPSNIDLEHPVMLRISAEGRFAAITNTHGRYGLVLDLHTGQPTMALDRQTYHTEHSVFSVAFFEHRGQPLLIHATDWKRLDISDPQTGVCLTQRELPSYRQGEPRQPHYLDYFHGGLTVSPGQHRVADNGWYWHPVGIVTTWRLDRWLEGNIWESEDGSSRRELCTRAYFWDGPLCWIDSQTLAVWGWGKDDAYMIAAVRLFDAITGAELRWFAGPVGQKREIYCYREDGSPVYVNKPTGALVFDTYLFSFAEEHGISVYDIATGEQLLHDTTLCPLCYHPGARQFLSLSTDGNFQLHSIG